MKLKCFRLFAAVLSASAVFIWSCQRQEEVLPEAEETIITPTGESVSSSDLIRNRLRIHVSEELGERLEKLADSTGVISAEALAAYLPELSSAGIIEMERTFPYAGEFEARTREARMHLWYEVTTTDSVFTKAGVDLSSINGVGTVEYRYRIVRPDCKFTIFDGAGIVKSSDASDYPFNDPYLEKQWHYSNDGTVSGGVAGCDINVFPAWEKYKSGSSDIIISVVDEGIDYSHPDLSGNMWHNPEQSREDWQYGYNFVTRGYLITPGDHGTHVAGTIGAVNNNGLGVCGVAGGDSKKGIPGVRLMSCQIFDDTEKGTANSANAIKWGADHGAVISQNSWGYTGGTHIQQSDKDAIDYFVKNAGCDSEGQQVGPMKGGVVFFAAGNDDAETSYPAAYEGCIAVTSLGADYRKAYYSNYGSWADIAATGGDASKGNQILSTLPGGKYGSMQGTSMSCPHVSGVAALIIANCGGQGFTNEELKNRLLQQVTSISKYNPSHELGSGLVNAYAAIAKKKSDPPEKVTNWSIEALSNNFLFSAKVPADPDDGKAYGINIHYSKSEFTDPADAWTKSFEVGTLSVGDYLSGIVSGLEFETKYYVAATAYDMSGSRSALSSVKTVTTGSNNPPEIVILDSTDARIKSHQTAYLRFFIIEKDLHPYECVLEPELPGTSVTRLKGDTIQVKIDGKATSSSMRGKKQTMKLKVTDEYEASAEQDISFMVMPNTPPYLKQAIPDLVFSAPGEVKVLDMAEYFADDDGEQLTYTVETDDNSIVNFNQSDNSLYATAMKLGQSKCVCIAMDAEGESVSCPFVSSVPKSGQAEIQLFPLPVKDVLNIKASTTVQASCSIYNGFGARVISCNLNLGPNTASKVDMSSLPGGVYKVRIQMPDKTVERNITKL